MNQPAKKKAANPLLVSNPLLSKPIPHAYALVPDPDRKGRFFAVHLTNVVARELEHLEPNARSAAAPHGLVRINGAMEKRHRSKQWDTVEPEEDQ